MQNKFLTSTARITDAYMHMYGSRRVNESKSLDKNGNLLKSLKGSLPIDGRGSSKTGSKLGVRKILPFDKRDAKNTCGHSVPMKKTFGNGKVKTINVAKGKSIRHEIPSRTGSRLGVRKVLPFEKRDDRPTSIGRIRNIKNVGKVSKVRCVHESTENKIRREEIDEEINRLFDEAESLKKDIKGYYKGSKIGSEILNDSFFNELNSLYRDLNGKIEALSKAKDALAAFDNEYANECLNAVGYQLSESVDDDVDDDVDVDGEEEYESDDSSDKDELLDLVLTTFEQIYDNLSDDDKETVDEVKEEIESVLNPGDEDGDSDDGFEYDVDDIDESMINERAGRRGRNRRGGRNGRRGRNRAEGAELRDAQREEAAREESQSDAQREEAASESPREGTELTDTEISAAKAEFDKRIRDRTQEIISEKRCSDKAARIQAIRELVPGFWRKHYMAAKAGGLKEWLIGIGVPAALLSGVGAGIAMSDSGDGNRENQRPEDGGAKVKKQDVADKGDPYAPQRPVTPSTATPPPGGEDTRLKSFMDNEYIRQTYPELYKKKLMADYNMRADEFERLGKRGIGQQERNQEQSSSQSRGFLGDTVDAVTDTPRKLVDTLKGAIGLNTSDMNDREHRNRLDIERRKAYMDQDYEHAKRMKELNGSPSGKEVKTKPDSDSSPQLHMDGNQTGDDDENKTQTYNVPDSKGGDNKVTITPTTLTVQSSGFGDGENKDSTDKADDGSKKKK